MVGGEIPGGEMTGNPRFHFHCWTETFLSIIKAITRLFVLRESKRFLVFLFTAVL